MKLTCFQNQKHLYIQLQQFTQSQIKMQQQVKVLIAKKDEMEKVLAQLQKEIKSINQAHNLQKGTVDSQGFPRADLDFGQLTNYRNLKRKHAQLNNDHFALMKQIQKHLFQIHKNLPEVDGEQEVLPNKQEIKIIKKSQQKQKTKMQQEKPCNIDYLTPFAKISFVNPQSPADKAGIKVQDLLSEFSEVNIYSIDPIKQIPKHVKQGKPLKMVVLRPLQDKRTGQNIFELKDGRNYLKIAYQITPSTWTGKGLLGCKIDPLH